MMLVTGMLMPKRLAGCIVGLLRMRPRPPHSFLAIGRSIMLGVVCVPSANIRGAEQ